mmetsp:Transcript_48418/g.97418  ORF Transcript_48418/g.97418 Transcript_48418/m.97418 type:complete len:203 (-) Transcript_48418:783-1391(-)
MAHLQETAQTDLGARRAWGDHVHGAHGVHLAVRAPPLPRALELERGPGHGRHFGGDGPGGGGGAHEGARGVGAPGHAHGGGVSTQRRHRHRGVQRVLQPAPLRVGCLFCGPRSRRGRHHGAVPLPKSWRGGPGRGGGVAAAAHARQGVQRPRHRSHAHAFGQLRGHAARGGNPHPGVGDSERGHSGPHHGRERQVLHQPIRV